MPEGHLPVNVPQRLQKDVVSLRHEVPVASGESRAAFESYYTPRLFRWALEQWLDDLPESCDGRALRRALSRALADEATFCAYLRVPEAFGELYGEEVARRKEDRAELDRVKRVMRRSPFARLRPPRAPFVVGLILSCALAAVSLGL